MHLLVHKHTKKRTTEEFSRSSLEKTFWVTVLDRLTLLVGILGPLTDLPQIVKILSAHSAAGVSALAWGGAAFFDIPFLCYGIVHRDRAITTTYTLWLMGNLAILFLTLLYS